MPKSIFSVALNYRMGDFRGLISDQHASVMRKTARNPTAANGNNGKPQGAVFARVPFAGEERNIQTGR